MISTHYTSLSQNNFDFSMTTSSGDKIELSMFDHQSLDYQHQKKDNTEQHALSLRHSRGYAFAYEGNGIDQQDKAEIAEALKEIKPLLVNYFENVQKSEETFSMDGLKNEIQAMKSLLPKPQDENGQNFLKDQLVATLDETLQLFETNSKMIEQAQKLFEKLMEDNQSFDIYG